MPTTNRARLGRGVRAAVCRVAFVLVRAAFALARTAFVLVRGAFALARTAFVLVCTTLAFEPLRARRFVCRTLVAIRRPRPGTLGAP